VRKTKHFAAFRSLRHAAVLIAAAAVASPIGAADMFPEQRPQSSAHASETLARLDAGQDLCLTPELQQLTSDDSSRVLGSQRRAAAWLVRGVTFAGRQPAESVRGIEFVSSRGAALRLESFPRQERAQRLDRIAEGVIDARRALESSGFPRAEVQIVLADLGAAADGYALPQAARRGASIVIDVDTPLDDLYRVGAHQYAHSVAYTLSDTYPSVWGEAFAVWTTQRALGLNRDHEFRAIDRRLERLHEGLASDAPEHATGNAVWLTFLESRWGLGAVHATVEELAGPGETAAALERGVRRASTETLRNALADFQLWSLFTGPRDDGRHLRSAARLETPRFTSQAAGLPALSIRADPALAAWGGARVKLLETPAGQGGLRVDFEGDFSANWEADLVLTSEAGAIHRVPLAIEDGRVELTVPLDGLAEAVLLVRRVGEDDPGPRGYSYSAHRVSGYPFELADVVVEPIGDRDLVVQWETIQEHGVVGFNVLRRRSDGGSRTRVNPVWVPALGAPERGVGYRFLDTTAEVGVRYEYTIQAVTETGLTSHSRATAAGPR